MEANRPIEPQLFKQNIRQIEYYSKSKMKVQQLAGLIQVLYIIAEYTGYVLTFLWLLSLRVLPDYPQVNANNPIAWIRQLPVFKEYFLLLAILLFVHVFFLLRERLSSGRTERSLVDEYMFAARSIIIAFLISVGITFLLKTTLIYSRVTLVVFVVCMLAESILWRSAYSLVIRSLNHRGILVKRILIIGAGKVGAEVEREIHQSRKRGNQIIGYLDDYKTGPEIIGRTTDLEPIIQNSQIDIIYITIPSERTIIENILHSIYKYNLDIRIIPERFDRISNAFAYRNDLDLPCMQIVKTPLRGINIVIKRLADIVGSILLLTILSPLFVCISILIKRDSKGTVFYKQQRIGKNGVPFKMLKFRSMHMEADEIKETLLAESEVSGPVFKMRNDPRITSIGKFLRKYSLDELPQLWNVLKGEMSLIGPRPPLPSEVEQYSSYHWRRMDVLPGMTGLWQVSGRSDLDFEEWVSLDIYYIEHWSLSLELKILLKTIPVVLRGTGAY